MGRSTTMWQRSSQGLVGGKQLGGVSVWRCLTGLGLEVKDAEFRVPYLQGNDGGRCGVHVHLWLSLWSHWLTHGSQHLSVPTLVTVCLP